MPGFKDALKDALKTISNKGIDVEARVQKTKQLIEDALKQEAESGEKTRDSVQRKNRSEAQKSAS